MTFDQVVTEYWPFTAFFVTTLICVVAGYTRLKLRMDILEEDMSARNKESEASIKLLREERAADLNRLREERRADLNLLRQERAEDYARQEKQMDGVQAMLAEIRGDVKGIRKDMASTARRGA